jgi:hypothetical protein
MICHKNQYLNNLGKAYIIEGNHNIQFYQCTNFDRIIVTINFSFLYLKFSLLQF